jgi:hypothetical protein
MDKFLSRIHHGNPAIWTNAAHYSCTALHCTALHCTGTKYTLLLSTEGIAP